MDIAVIEVIANVVGEFLIMLIGVFGAWLTIKLGKRAELSAINAAQQELISMAQITVGELQQTIVENIKAQRENGKLTEEDVKELGELLIDKTIERMSQSAYSLLSAAGVDIIGLIKGAGEDWVNTIKAGK